MRPRRQEREPRRVPVPDDLLAPSSSAWDSQDAYRVAAWAWLDEMETQGNVLNDEGEQWWRDFIVGNVSIT